MQHDEQLIEKLPDLKRRQILKAGVLGSLFCLCPMQALAQFSLTGVQERSLSLLNTHTGERLKEVVYWEKGDYILDALENLNHVLRDHRTNQAARAHARRDGRDARARGGRLVGAPRASLKRGLFLLGKYCQVSECWPTRFASILP